MGIDREVKQKERIDAPAEHIPFDAYQKAFSAVEWTNRKLGGVSSLIEPLQSLVRSRGLSSFNVLDVGCGGGDMDESLIRWAQKKRYGLTLIGIDSHPHAVRLAKERLAGHLGVNVISSDFFESKFSDGSFDFVISSLLIHHLTREQLSFFLWKAYRIARVGVVLTDLRRNAPVEWAAKKLITRMAPPSDLFANDAPLSFRRSYTLAEMRELLARGSYPYMAFSPWWSPFRIVLVAERPPT